MTMFNQALLGAMLEMVKGLDPSAIEVTAYEEVEKSDGCCETCYWEYTEVEITYLTEDGETRKHTYSGDFGELIRELTRER